VAVAAAWSSWRSSRRRRRNVIRAGLPARLGDGSLRGLPGAIAPRAAAVALLVVNTTPARPVVERTST
jgi:hypothetical protein